MRIFTAPVRSVSTVLTAVLEYAFLFLALDINHL